jgi:hypothetical protein
MNVDNIDYSKSIKSNKVVLKSKWMELIDFSIFFCVIIIFAIFNLKVLWIEGIQNNEMIWFFISPLSIVLMVYLGIKKVNEKNLLEIKTSLDKNHNKEFVQQFVKENGFITVYNNENYLIAESVRTVASRKQITFLFSSKLIKFNCLAIASRVRMPVFYYHYTLKRKLVEKINNSSLNKKV